MSSRTFAQVFVIGSLIAIVCACLTAAIFVAEPVWLPLPETPAETPVAARPATPVPTFTATLRPQPPTRTPTPALPTALPPTSTATSAPTATPSAPPVSVTSVEPTLSPTAPPPATNTPLPPTSLPPEIDFVVVQQRMRSNEENSWAGKIANNCGADHTIYVTVIDAAGNPLNDVLVGDTYDNVRAVSGTAGVGKLTIELWSNTMALEVQQAIDGTVYSSEQTVPLSSHDEEIPAEWLYEGGYCTSIAECQLRQQTNGLCRGHYSYDVTFRRAW